MFEAHQILLAALIGLTAGLFGGLAGIGGSMVMLPGLALVFGYDDPEHSAQHVYMAAAMAVNVVVSIPAAMRHARAGAVRKDLIRGIMPAMAVMILVGVIVSNWFPGDVLKLLVALFIALYCTVNILRLVRPYDEATRPPERTQPWLGPAIGAGSGFIGGMLGLGGGVVMVPMLQVFSRVRLRQAIGTSSAVMWMTASIGAAAKLLTLGAHERGPGEALGLLAAMAPGAVLGSVLGATLAHALPLRLVRGIISVLLLVAAAKLAGLF